MSHVFSSNLDKSNTALEVSLRHKLSGDHQLTVSFCLDHGKCLGVFGPSGSGKTTLLRIISGLTRVTSGSIVHRGSVWADQPKGREQRHRAVAYVPQGAPLIPNFSVFEHLQIAAKRPWQNMIPDLLPRLIDELELTPLLARLPRKLSGGERQRVSLSCALLQQAPLLLLDEPFSAFDAKLKIQAQRLVKDIQRTLNSESILVSHSLSELSTLADMALVIDKGRQQNFGVVASILDRLEYDTTSMVQFIQGKVAGFKDAHGKLSERSNGVWAVLESKLGELTVPIQDFDIGQICICKLSADSVLLTAKGAIHSAVNSFEGRIESIEHDNSVGLSTLKVRVNEHLVFARVPNYKLTNILVGIGNNVDVHLPQLKIV